MANSKISALTSATTPLAGTEVLPIVQNSTTKQVSVANLTAGRDVLATSIKFGSGTVLSTYEEGTWTPSVGGTATYTSQAGYYTKIGNFVKLRFWITINVLGTGSTTTITGIPFTPNNNQPVIVGGVVCYADSLATPALALGVYAQSDNGIYFFTRNLSLTGATTQKPAVIGNGFVAYCELSYQV
jgi:hypothetical protein